MAPPADPAELPTTPPWVGAAVGLGSAAVAVGTGELVAGFGARPLSPVVAVGNRVIDLAPAGVREGAIAALGTSDKPALIGGIVVLLAVVAVVVGLVSRTRPRVVPVTFAGFGAVGVIAAAADPRSGTAAVLAPIAAAAAGVGAWSLVGALTGSSRAGVGAAPPSSAPSPEDGAGLSPPTGAFDRRRFLYVMGGVAVVAAGTTALGRLLQQRTRAVASRLGIRLPAAADPLPAPAAATSLDVQGISPLLTPNDRFYRIDTALFVPQVAAEGWTVRIGGRVDRELRFTYDDLLARDLVEADITMACVSNEVGGDLVGTARWLGLPLLDLLEEAGIGAEVDQVLAESVDGFTAGFPLEVLRDGRAALLAVGMNGEPLPIAHGFPARLVVAGLYGYVSAVKWLSSIRLTTFAEEQGYWIPRGWAREGPIKTASRIDTPTAGGRVAAGRVPIAGVAWAPTRGVEQVEVQVDDGPWQQARLSAPLADTTWRQWVVDWQADPGRHRLRVRATDGTGATQPEERRAPAPDGATGWHTITVEIDA